MLICFGQTGSLLGKSCVLQFSGWERKVIASSDFLGVNTPWLFQTSHMLSPNADVE